MVGGMDGQGESWGLWGADAVQGRGRPNQNGKKQTKPKQKKKKKTTEKHRYKI